MAKEHNEPDGSRKVPLPQAGPMVQVPFHHFFTNILTSLMAVVLAWKLLLSRKRVKRDDENGNFLEENRGFMDEESPSPPPPPAMGPSSVLGLLSTDDLPSTDSSGEDRPPPPPPSLLMSQLPPFLHTINEEESDELRSISSASFASPRTVIESAVSDSDYRSPEARSPADFVHGDLSEPESPKTVVEAPFGEEEERPEEEELIREEKPEEEKKEEAPKAEEEELEELVEESVEEEEERPPSVKELVAETGDLLKELARLGQGTVPRPPLHSETAAAAVESSSTPERTIMSQVAREMQMIDDAEGGAHHHHGAGGAPYQGDRDRDQEEETVVYNEQRRKTINMDDTASLNSVSINLNATKESALNQSITSQPNDESSIMETTVIRKDRPAFRPPSPPNDLPPPPPDLQIRAGPPSHPPPPPPPLEEHPSPVRPAPPPPSILSTTALLAKAQEMTSGASDAARRSSFKAYADRSDQGMSSPPNEPPPPPPPPLSSSAFVYKSGFSSREDLLDGAPPSRSTVREIPVQRAPSAAPSAQSTVLDYRMPSSYVPPPPLSSNDMQDEYYRREVISRTIITRSTEALSQQPPLGRSSPIERYITYPDPNTREERSVDYRITHTRNIEEEERRIREEQDRRRIEEEDRRRREDEARRIWEHREREVLERLRRERELREIEAERTLTERERAEKDRIERDRAERERAEQMRRADWERMEAERRAIEEGELERRRQLELEKLAREREEIERRERERLEKERERLERERMEAERREQERLEKIRIERERIERERIEIERIERIKRERIERERIESQKRKEDEERIRREKEELERLERERRELEIRERELKEIARREAEDRERQRLEDEMRERKRREDERAEQELLRTLENEAAERERLRRLQERDEQERLERIRREQQRIEMEKAEADRRERERMEEERREKELLEASKRAKEMRELQRLEDIERERLFQEEERRERERREEARRAAAERERLRMAEEEAERLRLLKLESSATQRRAARLAEQDRDRQREELDREARLVAERERLENERRAREREEEERSLAQLKDKERRNQEIRDRERAEAAEREAARRADDRRSRDKLDHIVRERTERERFESEKRRLLLEKEAMSKKKYGLTSPETLAKLTRPAYFSRENLSHPEVTTKVERQVIERVDRNVWVDDIRVPSTTYQQQYSVDTTDDRDRDRLYNPHERNGSARGSRYRIQRARQQFFSTDSSADPEPLPPSSRLNRSTEDISLRAKPELRGPLLTKFHDSEFKSKTDLQGQPYPHVAPGDAGKEFERLLEETERKYAAYRYRNSQPSLHSRSRNVSATYIETDVDTGRPDIGTSTARIEETNLDDVHRRSGSVVDYNRMSRRDVHDTVVIDHTRSRSADYLMDRRLREETEPPENNLQKAMEHSPRESRMSEHEMRFRKSTEKLTVPDWYRENRPTARPTDLDNTLPRLPSGMFDKYAGELTDLRRSRQSLLEPSSRQIEPPSPKPRKSLSQEVITQVETRAMSPRALPGYTVSEIPTTWMEHVTTSKTSKVVEVADTFVGPKQMMDQYGNVSMRYGGRVTIEEVLDTIFQQTPSQSQAHPYDSSFSLPQADGVYQGNADGPGIYTQNYMLMDKVMREPEKAENLLKSEDLFVRCAHCHRTRELKTARIRFVSCKHCYTYYCSRQCRVNDWPVHTGRCSFARINTLCKDVIMKVREDPKAQAEMSRIARGGFDREGRGSVNIRLASPQLAQSYVTHGWDALSHIPNRQLLHYYTVNDLVRERKEPSLIALCRRYDPREKFILSVSIIADIEHCPQTPPPETMEYADGAWQQVPQQPMQNIYSPYSPLTLVPTDV